MVLNTEGRTSIDQGDAVMSYREAAAFLGVSQRSLQRYVHESRIPYVQLPKRGAWASVRFLRSELLRWLERRTVRPRSLKTSTIGRGAV
jgi:excisionase family DNA binding protein